MDQAAKSFIEVLEDEIRADLRRELEAEFKNRPTLDQVKATHAAGRFEVWMASHVGPITFKPQRAYQSAKAQQAGASQTRTQHEAQRTTRRLSTPSEPTARASRVATSHEPTFTARTSAELFALELLNRHSGQILPQAFTASELKAIWRKAALKSHPDRFAQTDLIEQARATALFRELAEAYETLHSLTHEQQAAA